MTGLAEPEVVPPDEPELDVLLEVLELLDELELDELDELDVPELLVDELPVVPVVVPVLEVDEEPAFLVVFDDELVVVVPVVPVVPVPEAPLCAPAPPEADPPLWPVLLLTPFPVPVVAPVPPTKPIKASTWQRTVALVALSTVPFSTTTVSTSPVSISTNRKGTLVFPQKSDGRNPACQAHAPPPRHKSTAIIFTTPQGLRRTLGISIGAISSLSGSGNIARPVSLREFSANLAVSMPL